MSLDIIWVGKFDFRKQLGLALLSISKIKERDDIRLHIVGEDKEEIVKPFKHLADRLGVSESVSWHGKVAHDKVLQMMRESDVFLFTSINEGTPHVVLEAIQENLPVVCFNTCGQGAAVDDTVGRKIEISTPEESANGFAAILSEMMNNREKLFHLKTNCYERSKRMAWEGKAKQMVEIYENITK